MMAFHYTVLLAVNDIFKILVQLIEHKGTKFGTNFQMFLGNFQI